MHSALMSVRFAQVQQRKVWRILRLLHRSRISLLASEMVAEHIGSVLLFVEKRHGVGRSPSTTALVEAVKLRFVGLTGGMQCCAFLKAALHRHFDEKKLHFFVTSRTSGRANGSGNNGMTMEWDPWLYLQRFVVCERHLVEVVDLVSKIYKMNARNVM